MTSVAYGSQSWFRVDVAYNLINTNVYSINSEYYRMCNYSWLMMVDIG